MHVLCRNHAVADAALALEDAVLMPSLNLEDAVTVGLGTPHRQKVRHPARKKYGAEE